MHPQRAQLGRAVAAEQSAKLDSAGGHLKHQLLQEALVHASPAITVQKTYVVQERALEESSFGDEVKGPSLMSREGPADRQFALDDRPSHAAGGLDFHEALSAVDHLDQEIRHDVARAGILLPSA